MFDFINMIGNHEQRKIDQYNNGKLCIDTCMVTDSDEPYETGIVHPNYNNNEWVIVEMYGTKEEAQKGHNKWIKIMTAKELPSELKDVSTSTIKKMVDIFKNLV